MLDPALLVEQGVEEVRDVAGRVHVGHVGLEALVDDDPVVDLDPAALENVGDGLDADPDDRKVRLDRAAVLRRHLLEAAVSAEGLDLVSEDELDALRLVQRGELVAQLLDAELVEEPAAEVDEGDLLADLAQRGRNLHPDEPGADDDRALCLGGRVADRLRVADGAQREDAVEVAARDFELSRPGAGGEQELAVREPVAVDLELVRLGVDALDGRLEHDLDAMVGVELLVLDDGLLVRLAAEELLGERRAMVGQRRVP